MPVRVVLPSRSDPRLRLGAIILSLQVLGQVGLGFKVSIAQIVVTIAVCGLVEMAITYWQRRELVWPASALLTGNSVAFILRTNGTHHGDWWSLSGIEFFLLAAVGGLLSKYVIRLGDRHLFNPSNLGLVLVFLLVGPRQVFPQYLWWGPLDAPVVIALAVILAGGVWVLKPLGMLPMVAIFLATFWLITGWLATANFCFYAVWAHGPVCGTDYWLDIALSPELLVFVFFMISDPKTAPRGDGARLLYGVGVAALAAVLIGFQPSEYGVKVALLAALVTVCGAVPFLEWLRPATRWQVAILAAGVVIALSVSSGASALSRSADALLVDGAPVPHGVPLPPTKPAQPG